MKNFTNNLKQFTSRLSARWFIMVLMLLVGTSSAWAAKLRGTLPGSDWDNGIQVNDNVGISINLDAGSTYEFKLFDDSKNKWFRDQYAGTMQRDNCTNWEFNYEGDGNTKIYADISGTYIFTFKWSNSKAYLTVTYPAQCTSCCTNYYLQHPWNGGNWTWKELKKEDCNNNIYTLTANYGNAGCDYSKPGVQEKQDYIANPILEGNPAKGDECIFTFDANNKTITITKVNKCAPTTVPQITLASNSICAGSTTTLTINEYNANSYSYKLYNGNNVVESPVFNDGVYTLSSAGNYYVTATPISGVCQVESAKQQTATTLTVTSVTLALDPTSAPICSSATIADISTYVTATVTSSEDANVNWYASEDATEELTDNTELKAQFYYAEAVTTSGCKSERKSFEVTSLLNAPSAPVIKSNKYAVCSGESVELTLEYKRVGETYTINDINNTEVFKKSNTWSTPALNSKTDYIVTATNSCGSTNSEKLTINVTTTPVITANKLVTTIDSPITLTSNIDAIWTATGGILNPNSEETSSVEFTSQNNGRYIITASNTANNITCSASKEVSVQNAFYVYIRRPKSGDNVYNDWYGKTNDAEKGNAPWFKEGTPNYDSMEDTNYGGVGPVESFTDCNDYTWDAFEFAGGNFYIHAPNTSSSDGWATFTRETYIASLTGDVYYYISSFKSGEKGAILSIAQTPERTPEIETPIVSLNPASGILCSGSQATLTVTNPQNDYTYTLMYKGTAQGEPISGNNEVEFTVIEAGSYAVQAKVQSNSGCTSTAFSSASQIKVIATDIKFDATEYTTTPWVPVTVVIEVPSGYEFTYNDATLTSITPEADKPIKKENGHEYIYTFPRPTDWGIGNSQSGDGYDEKPYTITATIKNAEQCGTATATVKLQDEGNDKCILPNQ